MLGKLSKLATAISLVGTGSISSEGGGAADALNPSVRSTVIAQSGVAASVTGTTTETTLATAVIPGGLMGPNDALRITTIWSTTNTANSRTLRVKFGSNNFLSLATSGIATVQQNTIIRNRNSLTAQVGMNAGSTGGYSSNTGNLAVGTVNTVVDQALTISGTITNPSDTVTLEGYTVELLSTNATTVVNTPAIITKPQTLAQSGIAAILAPNGTVAANGQITLGTALPRTYSEGVWLRLPAGAVVGGQAGMYYAVMSSTTVGTVYTNFVDPATSIFVPYVPTASLTVATGSAVAYTQPLTANIVLASALVPGGLMGTNGSLRSIFAWSMNSSGNAKVAFLKFGTTATSSIYSASLNGSVASATAIATVTNRNNQSIQVCTPINTSGGLGGGGAALTTTTVNTALDQPLFYMGQIGTAGEWMGFDNFSLEVLRPDANSYSTPQVPQPVVNVTTWANRQTAPLEGARMRVTDLKNREMVYENGIWCFVSNKPFSQCAIAVGIPPSGTIGSNGALTLGTALPMTLDGSFMYFPAGAINTGSAAGLYWTVMTSTTVGTVYNNTFTGGDAVIPNPLVPFSGTTGVAYTQSTGLDVTLRSFTLPAQIMGLNGAMRSQSLWLHAASTNNKVIQLGVNGANIGLSNTQTSASNVTSGFVQTWRNRGRYNSQAVFPYGSDSNTTSVWPSITAIDTSIDRPIQFTARIAVATDFIFLISNTHEVLPG